MSYGPLVVFSDTITSGASTSAGINLKRGWKVVGVQVSTMSTAAALTVQHSADAGTTFYNAFVFSNSSTTQANPLIIASGVGAGGGFVQLQYGGLNYVRFIASAVVSGGVGFKIVCSD